MTHQFESFSSKQIVCRLCKTNERERVIPKSQKKQKAKRSTTPIKPNLSTLARTPPLAQRQPTMTATTNNLLARTADIFENFFCCASATRAVQDDATVYTFPELPAAVAEVEDTEREERQDDDVVCSLKPSSSSSASTSDKAIIASVDSFVSSKKSSAGSIVFLDAMEPRIRPVLHFPASASIKTATTASMSSTVDSSFYSIPTIQGSQTFDSECSLASSSAAQKSISSATTAKIKTPQRNTYYYSNKQPPHDHDDNGSDPHSMRHVQTQALSHHLPTLSATDGYRC